MQNFDLDIAFHQRTAPLAPSPCGTPVKNQDFQNVLATLFATVLVRQDPLASSGSDLVIIGQKGIWAGVHALAAEYAPSLSATAGMAGDPVLGNQFTFGSHAIISRTEGCALSLGCGYALGQQLAKTGHRTYVVLDADDCSSPAMWKAAELAMTHRLRSLTAVIAACGANAEAIEHKLTAIGWNVKRVGASDDVTGAFAPTNLPLCIVLQPSEHA